MTAIQYRPDNNSPSGNRPNVGSPGEDLGICDMCHYVRVLTSLGYTLARER